MNIAKKVDQLLTTKLYIPQLSVGGAAEGVLDEWARMGVEGHFEGPHAWLNAGERVAAASAKLVGAMPGEVAVMNFLTVNLHLMMVSFYRPTPERHRIAMEPSPFPSDLYAAASQARFHGYDPSEAVVTLSLRPGEVCVRTEDIERFFDREGASVARLLLGGVNYYTGQAFELERICAAARRAGCVVWLGTRPAGRPSRR